MFKTVSQLLILVPALLGLKGNLDMCLASRLSTQANLGNMHDFRETVRMIIGNIALVQIQAIVAAICVALFAMTVGAITNADSTFVWNHAVLLATSSISTATSSCFILGKPLTRFINTNNSAYSRNRESTSIRRLSVRRRLHSFVTWSSTARSQFIISDVCYRSLQLHIILTDTYSNVFPAIYKDLQFSFFLCIANFYVNVRLFRFKCANVPASRVLLCAYNSCHPLINIQIHEESFEDRLDPSIIRSLHQWVSSMFFLHFPDFLLIGVIMLSYRFKMNPDNLATPLAASFGDVVSIGVLSGISSQLYLKLDTEIWVLYVILVLYFLLLPCWIMIVLKNEYTRKVLKTGWVPVLSALFISGLVKYHLLINLFQ